ncbi:MAG: Cna B-type domain-containing protein [Peptostreptococcaceae bacterium]|nr:Cna B-type domain-containing protein [Peptostreptococcaceae bacterium]
MKKILEKMKFNKNLFTAIISILLIVAMSVPTVYFVAAEGGQDFSNQIKKVTISKQVGSQWQETTRISDGDKVKINIEYSLPKGYLTKEKNKIYYNLPGGVKVAGEQSGRVSSNGKEVGTYRIGTDGKIEITFDDSFIESDVGIEGTVTFDGDASFDGTGGSGKINFPGSGSTITVIKPEVDNSDISTKKTGTINDAKNKVKYTVEVSTVRGTAGTVFVSDFINRYGSKNVEYSYEQSSLKVYKVWPNGGKSPVNPSEYNLKWHSSSPDLTGFEITGLPKLEGQYKYSVEYDVNVTNKLDSTNEYEASVSNNVTVSSGKKTDSGSSYISWHKEVSKSGTYDQTRNLIKWTIKVNPDHNQINGWTLIDKLKGKPVGKVKLIRNNPYSEEEIDASGGEIYYRFNKYNDTSDYTIEYYVEATGDEKAGGKAENTVEVWTTVKKVTVTGTVIIEKRKFDVSKVSNGSKLIEDKNLVENAWYANITLPEGSVGEFTYEDTIKNATSPDGKIDYGDDSHYAIANELEAAFKNSLVVYDKDTALYVYRGNGKVEKFANGNYSQTDDIRFDIKYFDKAGHEINKADDKTKIKSFKIAFTPGSGFELRATLLSIGIYKTYTDISAVDNGDTVKSVNSGRVKDLTKDAETTHKVSKNQRLEKGSFVSNVNGADIFKSKSETDFDGSKGRIRYRLMLTTKDSDNGDIVITDLLPKGTKFIPSSLKARFYHNEYYESETNYNGTTFVDGSNPSYTLENKDGSQILKIRISGYRYSDNSSKISIKYELDINGDEFWTNPENKEKSYKNDVTWGNDKASSETKVIKRYKKLDKKGQQLDINGNPLLKPDGSVNTGAKPSSNIKYSVVINPEGADLDKSSEHLTLVDELNGGEAMHQALDLDTLKLYKYDPTKADNKGFEIDSSNYSMQYDLKNSRLTLKIPDEMPYVLEYIYRLNPNFADGLTLNNKINLSGEWDSQDNLVLKDVGSSATATKKLIRIYKVDEDNYKKVLPNTEFKLESYDKARKTWILKSSLIKVNKDGYIQWSLSGGDSEISADTLYRLTETKPVDGYGRPDKPTYFILNSGENENASYDASGAIDAGITKYDLTFFSKNGGIYYITNKYTRLTVNKIWQDQSGKKIDNPVGLKANLQLYRSIKKPDGYVVKVILHSTASWVQGDKAFTAYVNKSTNRGITIAFPAWMGEPKYEYEGHSGSLESNNARLEIPLINKDTTVTITHNNNHVDPVFSNYDKAAMKLNDKQPVQGGHITLPNEGRWSYSWMNLAPKDAYGNDYYYFVEEEAVDGYTTTYTNNEGVLTGDINVINTAESAFPETGGSGRRRIYMVGLILISASLIILNIKKKKFKGNKP